MVELYVRITNWIKKQEGQDLVEYAVLLALIALVVWVAVRAGGTQISTVWNQISTELSHLVTAVPAVTP